MPVTGNETSKKSSEELLTSVGHSISGIDCGRLIDPLDTSSLNLMDVSSMTSFIKSDLGCDPTSSSLMLTSDGQNSFTSLSGTTTTQVLPPVSTFLFRDQWWDRNFDRLKNNTKDANDCECYAPDEREYSRTTSPSTLTTLPASLSNWFEWLYRMHSFLLQSQYENSVPLIITNAISSIATNVTEEQLCQTLASIDCRFCSLSAIFLLIVNGFSIMSQLLHQNTLYLCQCIIECLGLSAKISSDF